MPSLRTLLATVLAISACAVPSGDLVTLYVATLDDRTASTRERIAAARSLGDLAGTAASAAPSLVGTFQEPSRALRAAASEALSKMGAEILPSLVTAMGDPNPDVREFAAYSLLLTAQRIPATSAKQALLVALRDPSANVRTYAIRALWFASDRHDPEVIAATLAATDDEHHAIRRAAAHQLGRRGVKHAVPALVSLIDDPHPQVRSAARSALREIGSEEALVALAESERGAEKGRLE